MVRPAVIAARSPSFRGRARGFSMTEVLIGSVLLLISGAAMASVFRSSLAALRFSGEEDAISAAISADLAAIEKVNTYYACPTGSCAVGNLSGPPPNKFQYAPSSTSVTAATAFRALCSNESAQLVDALVAYLQPTTTIPVPYPGSGGSLSISRSVRRDPANANANANLDRNRYIVEWVPSRGPTRQILLTPTVAAWCP